MFNIMFIYVCYRYLKQGCCDEQPTIRACLTLILLKLIPRSIEFDINAKRAFNCCISIVVLYRCIICCVNVYYCCCCCCVMLLFYFLLLLIVYHCRLWASIIASLIVWILLFVANCCLLHTVTCNQLLLFSFSTPYE